MLRRNHFWIWLLLLVFPILGGDCEDEETRIITTTYTRVIDTTNESWESWFPQAGGVNGTVYAAALDPSGRFVIGGSFSHATGGVSGDPEDGVLNNIAYWDGQKWQPLGTGVNGTVYALAFDSQGRLYVGGAFTRAGYTYARNFARYDFATGKWENVGSTNNSVRAIAIDGNGQVYIGGEFTTVNIEAGGVNANRIARFDPSSGNWNAVGTGANNTVYAFAVDSNNNLYVGGSFTNILGVVANRICRINNPAGVPTVTSFPNGIDNGVNNIVFTVLLDGTRVYVGGTFTYAGNFQLNYVGYFDTSNNSWSSLGGGASGFVYALFKDSQGRIFVGGNFTGVGPNGSISGTARVAYWMNGAWHSLGNGGLIGAFASVRAFAKDVQGNILVGGVFSRTSDSNIFCSNVILWKPNPGWQTFGPSQSHAPDGSVIDIATLPDGRILVVGDFSSVGSVPANRAAIYNPTTGQWSRPWPGGPGGVGDIYSVSVASTGDIYIGGDWTTFYDVNQQSANNSGVANRIAKWNTARARWESLGNGANNDVYALLLDEARGYLYVGGAFTAVKDATSNNVPNTSYIARWNIYGQYWEPVAFGLNGVVYALALDSQGRLYVGGAFFQAIQSSSEVLSVFGIVRYNPVTNRWESIGSANGIVYSLATSGNFVYAGGTFTIIGGVNSSRVARWNGQRWESLGGGLAAGSTVYSLAVWNNILFVGGSFSNSGFTSPNIAFWQDGFWFPMGAGANGPVYSLRAIGNYLWVGGIFNRTGDKNNGNLGVWRLQ